MRTSFNQPSSHGTSEQASSRQALTDVQATHSLTDAQAMQFERDGYLVLPGLFSPEEIKVVEDTFMDQAQDGPVEGLSEMKYGAQDHAAADPLAFYPRMMNPHSHPDRAVGRLAMQFMLDSRLRGPLSALMNEEPLAVQSMFYFKPAGARGHGLHQDNFFLRVQPGTCLAAWIAVDYVDAGNGGMMVVPGSSHAAIVCPEASDPSLSFTTEHVPVPEGMETLPVNMTPGDVLFFNGSLIHGSTPNTSTDRFRRSLIFHYVPRFSQEMSESYQNSVTFDGEIVGIAPATGGGPCGTARPVAMSPH